MNLADCIPRIASGESHPAASLNYNPAMLPKALIFALVFSFSMQSTAAENYARSVAELETLKQDIADLKKEIIAKQKKEDTITADLDRVEQELVDLNSQIRSQVSSRVDLMERIDALEEQSKNLKIENVRAVSQLGQLLQSAYILGKQSGLRMLISQQDPHRAARRMTMFKFVTEAKNRRIHEVIDLHTQIIENQENQRLKNIELEETIAVLEQNQQKLKATEAEKSKQLIKVQQALAADQSKAETYKQREQALQRLLKKIASSKSRKPTKTTAGKNSEISARSKQAADLKQVNGNRKSKQTGPLLAGFSNNKGKLSLPLEAGLRAKFGQKKQESGLRWEGILFNSRKGQAVKAIYPGQVVFSDWFRGYGQLMVLDHGEGYMSLYGHNQALEVEIGDIVQANQVIALASESSQNPSPGLYFEIRHNGNPDDPLKWCR